MHNNYKTDERVLKEIIHSNVKCKTENTKIDLRIYYVNKKSASLVMVNNIASSKQVRPLQRKNVVYQFTCPYLQCKADYIGMTTKALENRLTQHVYNGSIKKHVKNHHNEDINKQILIDNTQIIDFEQNRHKLYIKEAIYILNKNPSINRQFETFTSTLKLYRFGNSNHNLSSNNPDVRNLEQYRHPVSPSINNRVNSLLQNSNQSEIVPNPPSNHSMVLRSRHTLR